MRQRRERKEKSSTCGVSPDSLFSIHVDLTDDAARGSYTLVESNKFDKRETKSKENESLELKLRLTH